MSLGARASKLEASRALAHNGEPIRVQRLLTARRDRPTWSWDGPLDEPEASARRAWARPRQDEPTRVGPPRARSASSIAAPPAVALPRPRERRDEAFARPPAWAD